MNFGVLSTLSALCSLARCNKTKLPKKPSWRKTHSLNGCIPMSRVLPLVGLLICHLTAPHLSRRRLVVVGNGAFQKAQCLPQTFKTPQPASDRPTTDVRHHKRRVPHHSWGSDPSTLRDFVKNYNAFLMHGSDPVAWADFTLVRARVTKAK